MMRYSEFRRDCSPDGSNFIDRGEEFLYRNLREDSPPAVRSAGFQSIGVKNPVCLNKGEPQLESELKCTTDNRVGSIEESFSSSLKYKRKNSLSSGRANLVSSPDAFGYLNTWASGGKTQSLPANTSMKGCNDVILNALHVFPEELANQITLLDFTTFSEIQPDELTSCAWTKREKLSLAPNIVSFTKRFNHTMFWTVEEILAGESSRERAETVVHFIKIAKKLYELNNLHSLFAIISALQSASIFRLQKTWGLVSKKDRQSFDRLADIFNDKNNWQNLREYIESLRLPCIPYLGLFLTDFIYIDLAHPHTGGLESEQRKNKMNNILRVISNYQQSDYKDIIPNLNVQRYIKSIRYIEELQNIFEEDQYKKSIALEPSSTTCNSKEALNVDCSAIANLNLSPAKIASMRVSHTSGKFRPLHRKCRSLGSKFRSTSLPRNFHQNAHCPMVALTSGTGTLPNVRCKCRIFSKGTHCLANIPVENRSKDICMELRHPLDDSVLENKNMKANEKIAKESTNGEAIFSLLAHDESTAMLNYEGCVRRKTVLKEGRKPAVASWQRYWLQIWATSLVYFAPKSFKGSERCDFKREPCKVCSLSGWLARETNNPKQKNTFELLNGEIGTLYKFRTDSSDLWVRAVKNALRKNSENPSSINLMTFE